jgi:hypothetical protein
MSYTERFTEGAELLYRLAPVSVGNGAEAFTTYVHLEGFHRAIIKISVGVMAQGSTIDAQVHQDYAAAGGGAPKHITGKLITQLTQASGDSGSTVIIELRTEELDVDGGFDWISLGYTVGTAASLMAIEVWGLEPRYRPVATTSLAEIVG